jgi:hypothetical protein
MLETLLALNLCFATPHQKTDLICDEGEVIFCYILPDGSQACFCKTLYTAQK